MADLPTLPPSLPPQGSHNHDAKIAIIGGGSIYCANLLKSIIRTPAVLRGCHIVLMDTDEERLSLVYTVARKLFQHAELDITLEQTTSQEEALADADFVLTTFRTGGLDARIRDEKIPLRHDIIGHDSIGPGGFFYALRTAPVLVGLAAMIEKVAPRAFLLNYTNPSTIVLEAIAHSSGIRVIGLNDRPLASMRNIVALTDSQLDTEKQLHPRTIGLSYCNWTTAVWSEGENILPGIVTACEQYINSQPEMTAANYKQVMLATLVAYYKAIPSQYMHYYYFPEKVLEFQKESPTSPAEKLFKDLSELVVKYRAESQCALPQLTSLPDDQGLSELMLAVLRSILDDTGEEWVLNVQNNGSLNFLEDGHVVQLPCRVDARGATPLTQGTGGLEMDQRGLIAMLAEYEGATARAALWGNRRSAIKALAANPLVMSYSKAERLYDDLAAAHARYLPERLLK